MSKDKHKRLRGRGGIQLRRILGQVKVRLDGFRKFYPDEWAELEKQIEEIGMAGRGIDYGKFRVVLLVEKTDSAKKTAKK